MSQKMKILLLAGLATLLLVVGVAVPVVAQDTPTPTPTPPLPEAQREGMLEKVAKILGVSKDTLTSAFQQAKGELRDESLSKMLDKLVEKGLITKEEAQEAKEWLAQRPPVVDRFLGFRFLSRIKARRSHEIIGKHFQKRWGAPKPVPRPYGFLPRKAN